MHPQLVDLDDVAELIAVSTATARRWAAAGKIPGVRVGGQWRFWAPAVLTAVVGPEAVGHAPAPPAGYIEPGVVPAADLADLLGIHPRTVSVLLLAGEIPARKVGHQWRAYWPAIRDRIAAGQALTPSDPEVSP